MMPDEERVQRLLRLADPGPEIPAGGEQRIREAVRPVWKKGVRQRSARRMFITGSLAAAAGATLFFIPTLLQKPEPVAPPMPVAHVELVRGPVDQTLQHRTLVAGSRIHTLPSSRAALRVTQGSSLRLDSDTIVHLVSAHVVELEQGALYIDSGGLKVQPMEVRTRLGVVRDIGTRFEVRAGDQLLVRVREGSVHVNASSKEFVVNAGFESTIQPDGSQKTSSLVVERAAWSAGVAPPFPIEGRSVAALLDWCSRESGLPVRYAGKEAEHIALTTVLHGPPVESEPVDSAETILPTAGLQAVRENGVLMIRPVGPKSN